MNFKGNFLKLGQVDVASLKEVVLALTEEDWSYETWRQEAYVVHNDTRTISLIFDRDFRHSNPTVLPVYKRFEPLLKPALSTTMRHFNMSLKAKRLQKKNGPGYFIRIILVKMLPGSTIPEHIDNLFSLAHSHRIHMPLITNKEVLFTVDGEIRNLAEGEIWEINNRKDHTVTNGGDHDRLHFIFDWVIPGEPCCCSKKTHPGIPCSPDACRETDESVYPCDCI